MITLKSIVRHIKTIKRFAGDRKASTSIIMGVIMLPVMAITGAAVDYSRAMGTAQKLQAALDTATLAGAIIALRNREEQSQAVFSAALPQDQIGGSATATFQTTESPTLGSLYYGEATVTIPTAVMKVLGINSITIKRKAQAVFGTVMQNNTESGRSNFMDAKTLEACTNAKAAGVKIFTVGFSSGGSGISSDGQALSQACASTPSNYYLANSSSALLVTFIDIGNSLQGQHISR